MPTNFPFMLILLTVLLLVPMRLSSPALKRLAFFLWFTGGIALCMRGGLFIMYTDHMPPLPANQLSWYLVAALVVGWLKGQFILSKTSARNLERLNQLAEPQKPVHVYSLRSWVVIGIMVLISQSLTWFGLDTLWRGLVNFAIGFGLVISSMTYLRAIAPQQTKKMPTGIAP